MDNSKLVIPPLFLTALLGLAVFKEFLHRVSGISTKRSMPINLEERKVNINGVAINYVEVGTGPHPVLLLPGALGTIWTDFELQISNLDKEKFSIVAWDPPGYGNSRPPKRKFGQDFLARDARIAHDFMKAIGYHKFSVLGWCNGGVTAFFLAAMYPDSVEKMVTVGTSSFVTSEELTLFKDLRELGTWPKKLYDQMTDIYGYDYLKSTWDSWVEQMEDFYDNQNGDICKNILSKIRCPTLIVHGKKDRFIDISHARFLSEKIEHSRLLIIENAAHYLHVKRYQEFNRLVTEFFAST